MIQPIFCTPVYSDKIDNFNKIQEELLHCVSNNIEFEYKKGWDETHFISDSTFNNDCIGQYNLINFYDELKVHLKKYCSSIGYNLNNYKISSSWFSLFNRGNYGHLHSHGFSDISGVYYLKTNGNDGNIYFETPNPFLDSSICYRELSNTVVYKPKEGELLLFPGWLKHGISKNTTDNERVSLSFNIVVDR